MENGSEAFPDDEEEDDDDEQEQKTEQTQIEAAKQLKEERKSAWGLQELTSDRSSQMLEDLWGERTALHVVGSKAFRKTSLSNKGRDFLGQPEFVP